MVTRLVEPAALFADVRDAMGRLEAAISRSDPALCRGRVTDSLAATLADEVDNLRKRGRRRVHAGFEVLDLALVGAPAPDHARLRVRAVSSLDEVDAGQLPARALPTLYTWTQDLDAVLEEHRWKIDRLGRMSVEGPVVGPASTPDPVAAAEQETRAAERDREARREAEWWEDITHAGLSFLRMRGVGM